MLGFKGDGCQLSDVRFQRLPAMRLAAFRRLGPYSDWSAEPFSAGDQIWRPLRDWAEASGMRPEPLAIVFCPDSPGVTPPALMRMDACLPVASAAPAEGHYRTFEFPGGWHAVIQHSGDWETIDQAYRGCADGIRRSDRYVFREGPPVQFFRVIGETPADHVTEVCFPVRLKG